MADKTEIESLLYLMDDPDPVVQTGVQERFRQLGEDAVPLLDQFRISSSDTEEKDTINEIIHSLTIGTLHEDFSLLLDEGLDSSRQLEKAVLLLSRFGNPTLRTEEYKRKMDAFARQVYSDIAYEPNEVKKMRILTRFIFNDLGFRGDDKDYHNPDNAYIDRVIDRRKGLPISLSLFVLFLARRLDLPFYGVNMPIHFMLMYRSDVEEILIDPFDNGKVVTYDQCHHFLKKNGIDPRPSHFQRASEYEILARTIRNLMHSYVKAEKESRVQDLQKLLRTLEAKA